MPDELALTMPLRDWSLIDGTLDNAVHHAIHVSYDDGTARRGRMVREAGWRVTGPITRPFSDSGRWPPPDVVMDQTVTIECRVADWQYIVTELRHGGDVSESVGNADSAAWSRDLAAQLERSLP